VRARVCWKSFKIFSCSVLYSDVLENDNIGFGSDKTVDTLMHFSTKRLCVGTEKNEFCKLPQM
jgi:hypothetical protein